eukprot:1195380-Prorocentrum_minimum.AAC.4
MHTTHQTQSLKRKRSLPELGGWSLGDPTTLVGVAIGVELAMTRSQLLWIPSRFSVLRISSLSSAALGNTTNKRGRCCSPLPLPMWRAGAGAKRVAVPHLPHGGGRGDAGAMRAYAVRRVQLSGQLLPLLQGQLPDRPHFPVVVYHIDRTTTGDGRDGGTLLYHIDRT